MQDIASQRQRLVAESLQNLASGMETMADAQEQLGSVATSSHRRSQQALEMVQRERDEREKARKEL